MNPPHTGLEKEKDIFYGVLINIQFTNGDRTAGETFFMILSLLFLEKEIHLHFSGVFRSWQRPLFLFFL